ncbi:FecCD family ABC transporter permease [Desulfolithobacter sp.]
MNATVETLCRRYRERTGYKVLFLCLSTALLAVAIIAGLSTGASGLSPAETMRALFRETGRTHSIIWMLRLPRVLMAALVGFGLGIAGTVFQAILRNPLASPFTLGVGSAAGFGAVTVILFLGGGFQIYRVAGSAFAAAMVSGFLILAVARMKRASAETMILTGIAQMFLFSSLTSLFQYMGTMEQVHEVVFWFFGSLSKAGWHEIGMATVLILAPLPLLLRRGWDFNLLAGGDESAMALGVDVERLRMWGVIAGSLMTAGSICFTGVIGFVGLVAPHITRMVIGSDHRFLLPAAGLVGAVVVVAADTLGRTLWTPRVIPIGIMTSFIGVPFFFYLLLRRTREYW